MPLIYVGVGILLMLFFLMVVKLDAFFSILITAVVVGLLNGMEINALLDSILSGIGGTMGKIILILVFGAMLGKLIEESGAAHTITYRLTKRFGLKNIQYAILVTGFLVGLPMMYNASFLVLIPLIYTFATTTRLPLMYLGIPLSATLSIAHAYLPPHPAPVYISMIYGADINLVLVYGLVPVIPACLIAGILLSKFFTKLDVKPPEGLHEEKHFERSELPGLGRSVFTALIPVILMLIGAAADMILGVPPARAELMKSGQNLSDYYLQFLNGRGIQTELASLLSTILSVLKFLSDANIALMMAVMVGIYTLGIRQGKKIPEIMKSLGKAVSAIAMIVLIIAAGGAFSQVLKDSEVNIFIAELAGNITLNPLILSFCVAALLRLAIGSATVATMTAAPIMLPIAINSGISPELMVLATGSGSLMFSHFNDVGFWMFKEYYNVSVKHTFAIWTVMECLVALVGLSAALALNRLI
jgi:H+/gluconate symporter-like permease